MNSDKKIVYVKVRMSTDDKELLKKLAAREGKRTATYFRSLIHQAARQTGLT